jgi:hypothetical protein
LDLYQALNCEDIDKDSSNQELVDFFRICIKSLNISEFSDDPHSLKKSLEMLDCGFDACLCALLLIAGEIQNCKALIQHHNKVFGNNVVL